MKLKLWLMSKGISQRQFSKEMKWDVTKVNKIINGDRPISLRDFPMIESFTEGEITLMDMDQTYRSKQKSKRRKLEKK